MPVFQKESLELLRQRIEIIEVLNPYVDLKPAGSSYKGLCPFHDEKTPSFVVQRGDQHYHCYGCGAHGDAIHFLMQHVRMSFSEAVESLAQRFRVHLEYAAFNDEQGKNKKILYEALETACRFYHFYLLHTKEGHNALEYLYGRGIDLDFIKQFKFGLAPETPGIFRRFMNQDKISDDILLDAGLVKRNERGGMVDFFYDRITIPIHHPSGAVIGFSARKYKEATFGGKYVNSTETLVFKKSRVLFGLNYSRRRIAKEGKAILVEGQLDALRLIQEGFDITVAGQGTAIGEGHVQELTRLGVKEVHLALDSDEAGIQAAMKTGNLFQKEGVEVYIVQMPPNTDPDAFLREHGPETFLDYLNGGIDYLTFLVKHWSSKINMSSPAEKNAMIQRLSSQIRLWDDSLMVHESLRKLARLTQVPEEMISVDFHHTSPLYIKKSASIGTPFSQEELDPHKIIEMDFLRWIVLHSSAFLEIAKKNIAKEDLRSPICRVLYEKYFNFQGKDLLSFISQLEEKEQEVLHDLLEKKVDTDKAYDHFLNTIKKILQRNWMEKRENIRMKIQSGDASDDEIMELCKEFDALKNNPPEIVSESC